MKDTITNFIKDHIFIILGVACVVAVGLIYVYSRLQPGRVIQPHDILHSPTAPAADVIEHSPVIAEPPATEEERIIIVHIVGEVNNPDVFELPYGSRVRDVLQMAGGATEYANLARVNLAAVVSDAMQIIIPAIGEDVPYVLIEQAPAAASGVTAGGLVNINTATSAELQTLPRVGPAMAQRIIDFRETHGSFSSVDELIHVSGIGESTLAGLRDLVTVGR